MVRTRGGRRPSYVNEAPSAPALSVDEQVQVPGTSRSRSPNRIIPCDDVQAIHSIIYGDPSSDEEGSSDVSAGWQSEEEGRSSGDDDVLLGLNTGKNMFIIIHIIMFILNL